MSAEGQVTKKSGLLSGLRIRDMQIIGSTWLRFAFRSGGGVFSLFLVVVIGLMIPGIMLQSIDQMILQGDDKSIPHENKVAMIKYLSESNMTTDTIAWLLDGSAEESKAQSAYLLKEKPALLSLALLIMMYIVPLGAAAASFNQTAGDIGNRGLRFILSRSERPNIFLGRFISAFLFVSLSFTLIIGLVVGYLHFKMNLYEGSELLSWGLHAVPAFIAFGLPYVALAAWISCCMRTPFSALSMTYLASLAPTLFLLIVKATLGEVADMELAWLPKLMPWGWKFSLFAENSAQVMTAYAAMIGFAFLFLFLGLVTFRNKDL